MTSYVGGTPVMESDDQLIGHDTITGTLECHGFPMLNPDFYKQPGIRNRIANMLNRLATWIDDPIRLTDRELHAANDNINRLRRAMSKAQQSNEPGEDEQWLSVP